MFSFTVVDKQVLASKSAVFVEGNITQGEVRKNALATVDGSECQVLDVTAANPHLYPRSKVLLAFHIEHADKCQPGTVITG